MKKKKVKDLMTGVVYDYVDEKLMFGGEVGVFVEKKHYGAVQYDPNKHEMQILPIKQCEIFEEEDER